MARVKRSMMKNKRKSKILKLAKGFRHGRSTKYKEAKVGVIHAGVHAFAHRRKKKRVMRKHWQIKISYAVQDMAQMSYSAFIDILTKKNIGVDRKIMADMIENDPAAFERFLMQVVDGPVTAMSVVAAPKTPKVKAEKVATKTAATKTKSSPKEDDVVEAEVIETEEK